MVLDESNHDVNSTPVTLNPILPFNKEVEREKHYNNVKSNDRKFTFSYPWLLSVILLAIIIALIAFFVIYLRSSGAIQFALLIELLCIRKFCIEPFDNRNHFRYR